jgi:ketosteroid isomerase-like protein
MPTLDSVPATGQSEATQGIDRARELIDAAWTRSDADGITRYLAEDAVLLPPNDSPITGRGAINAWLREFFKHYSMTDLTMPERLLTVSGNLVVEASRYKWKLIPKAGGDPIVDDVSWVGIWERRADGEWWEVRGIWNSRLPG